MITHSFGPLKSFGRPDMVYLCTFVYHIPQGTIIKIRYIILTCIMPSLAPYSSAEVFSYVRFFSYLSMMISM